jgi:hypothetical protein
VGEMKNAYTVLIRIPMWKRPYWRSMYIWKNIKIDLKVGRFSGCGLGSSAPA